MTDAQEQQAGMRGQERCLGVTQGGTGCMDLRAQFLSSRSHSLLLYCYYYSYCLDKKSPYAVEVKAGSPFLFPETQELSCLSETGTASSGCTWWLS